MDKKMRLFRVACEGQEPIRVMAVDRLRAISTAGQAWGVRWTEIARGCSVTDLGPAPETAAERGTTRNTGAAKGNRKRTAGRKQ